MVVQMLMVAGAEPTPLRLRAVESRSARRVQQDDEQDPFAHPAVFASGQDY